MPPMERLTALTERERSVARHVAAGSTNKAIAAALGCSPRTVEHHVSSIYRKLDVRTRAELGALLRSARRDADAPAVKYARAGSTSVAWHEFGSGPVDVVLAPGFVSHLEVMWEEPRYVEVLRRISSFARVICFDKRGTGLSDPISPTELPPIEDRVSDLRAVLDAAGSKRAVLFGWSEGGSYATMFASTHPERVGGLLLFAAVDAGPLIDPAFRAAALAQIEAHWGDGSMLALTALSIAEAPDVRRWLGRLERHAASPAMAAALIRMLTEVDIRGVLRSVSVPTVVLHREGDPIVAVEHGRRLAQGIPDARYRELPGHDHVFWTSGTDELIEALHDLVAAAGRPARADAQLLSIVHIAGAADPSAVAARCSAAGARLTQMSNGAVVAAFHGPGRATTTALQIAETDPAIRVGVQIGECHIVSGGVTGLPTRAAATLARQAAPGEVLVTGTVRDLVVGSPLCFSERGERTLDGSERCWPVLAASTDHD